MSKYQKSPYPVIPEELLQKYSMGGQIPILEWYFDGTKDLHQTEWSDKYIESYVERFTPDNIKSRKHGKEPYYNGARDLLNALEKYSINDMNVAVVGSTSPWVEAILLNLGNRVTTVEYNVPQKCSRVKCISYWDFENTKGNYDCIVSYSSIEHSGLGRYGDPLDVDGDIKTIDAIRQNLKVGGIFVWAGPVGHDTVVWNAHRIYGKIRLPILFNNFLTLEWFGHDASLLNRKLDKNAEQPTIVLLKS